MSCNLQLQRNTKVFFSTIDLDGGGTVASMTPANTWRLEVLAGYAVSQSATTQDITSLESGTSPDRSTTRFNTVIDPVEWNFQVYMRPTGEETVSEGDGVSDSANVRPLADWFLWQALFSNAAPAIGGAENSAWQDEGIFSTATRATSANVAAHSPNSSSAQENHLYFLMDNIVYQVKYAAVNEATVDAAIDEIATTTWTGFGRTFVELQGIDRNNAISVFGGVLNDGTDLGATGNANAYAISAASSYHPWASWNVGGTIATASFIKNKLSTIDLHHTPDGGAAVNYVFPVTALSWSWNNNITYLTPEELNTLNSPIGNFTGARTIGGSITAYLRHQDGNSANLLRNIVTDTRVSHSNYANANVQVGGLTAPYVAFYMPAVQYNFPTHSIEDIITVTAEYLAQEPASSCGDGGEVTVFVKKS